MSAPAATMAGMLSIGTIVLTVEDIARASAFWTAALGYRHRSAPSEDWTILDPPEKAHWSGREASIALSVTGYPQHYPPRIHLDLYAEDQAAEVQRLRALGAREVDWHGYPADADWIVLEDTEGNRFCVIATGPFTADR
ncbi:Glyoxalase/bleomycin resistance protein/dioxygenase [uncultured Microbacterium sp.]|uniref:Glyoxalase/bleomycin resistance protein/dioxygenase n=2 Tax=uncultured Microbacterium sp. TaxID=191216 RepID=A0A1Y5NYR7_9MICO|nr:Glyoxalase/bleomycin resistance protein/dioxygenase [uncultured Microbacterium sp.]